MIGHRQRRKVNEPGIGWSRAGLLSNPTSQGHGRHGSSLALLAHLNYNPSAVLVTVQPAKQHERPLSQDELSAAAPPPPVCVFEPGLRARKPLPGLVHTTPWLPAELELQTGTLALERKLITIAITRLACTCLGRESREMVTMQSVRILYFSRPGPPEDAGPSSPDAHRAPPSNSWPLLRVAGACNGSKLVYSVAWACMETQTSYYFPPSAPPGMCCQWPRPHPFIQLAYYWAWLCRRSRAFC